MDEERREKEMMSKMAKSRSRMAGRKDWRD